jgi:hypothetical protein
MYMMLCDTDHVVHAAGDGLNEDDVTLTSMDPDILEIDSNGNVTLKSTGAARIKAVVPADETYAERTVYLTANVDRHEPYKADVPFHYAGRDVGDGIWGIDLDVSDGPQQLVITLRPGASILGYTSDNPDVAAIDDNGVVTPVAAGDTALWISFDDGGGKYKTMEAPLLLDITITGTAGNPTDPSGPSDPVDPSVEKPGKEADKPTDPKAALKKEIAKAKSLKRPAFRVKARKGHKNKLTWGKVANADGYIVYIKYPGTKKYVKAVTRNRTVKSVVHRGLSKGKVYRYKVRAYKKVKGKTYYGPYSKARKVRAK